jgi:hypothetical protein
MTDKRTGTNTRRFPLTLDAPTARSIELSAQAMGITIPAYIRYCVQQRGQLLQENSNLRARLRDAMKTGI